MARISEIDIETAPRNVKDAVAAHIAAGHRITPEKRTLLHCVPAFNALEEGAYALDDELQRLIGKRAGDFFEYAVSAENECLVCTRYFENLLHRNGIDFATFEFTDREKLLLEYGRVIAKHPKEVSDELFGRMREEFTEEEIVAITTMGVMMVANNHLNDILQIPTEEPEE